MKYLLTLCFVSLSLFLSAQVNIEAVPVYKGLAKTPFTAEWQYLSTDLYLFNADKFSLLLNEVVRNQKKGQSKRFRKKDKIDLHNLVISTNLKAILGSDVVYPIYSFQVKEDKEKNFRANVSKGYEVVRLVDNLPMVNKSKHIEMELKAEAYSSKEINKIYKLVAMQMQNIANFANPASAIELVGEMGKFLESNVMNSQYQFSNTIRIYEEQDFNKRLHSIYVYVFAPAGEAKKLYFRKEPLQKILDTALYTQLDREYLDKAISFNKYPFIVIANYKSRYVSEPVVGDEIDFEKIEARRQKIEKDYSAGLMNKDSYVQELKLIDFLKVFSQLKVDIQNYQLNYKNRITDNFSKSFFIILSEFRQLKNTFYNRKVEFSRNNSFNQEFKPKYESILLNAELYLESNTQLKNIKELVNVLFEFEHNKYLNLSSQQREDFLRKLYAVELPTDEENSEETSAIKNLIKQLEKEQFNTVFAYHVKDLNNLLAIDENFEQFEQIKKLSNSTYCKRCKTEINKAVEDFQTRLEKNRHNKLYDDLKIQNHLASDLTFTLLQKVSCIENHLKEEYPDSVAKPDFIVLYSNEFAQFKKSLNDFKQFVATDYTQFTNEELSNQKSKILRKMKFLRDDFDNLCNKIPKYCECE